MEQAHAPAYRLVRRPVPTAPAARLDEAQQAVVDHSGGPLLVLAGPGTGKTTTIVAAVADRIERRGLDPERVLVLTFSRKAAAELRERITARLRRTTREPLAMTFHSYAYALARREFVLAGDEPPRLLSAPEQLLEVRRMLRGEAQDGGARWPEALRPALATRGFAEEVRDLLLRAAERGLDGRGLGQLGKQRGRDDWMAAAAFLDRYAARFDLAPVPAYDYAEIVRIAAALLTREEIRQRERAAYDVVFVDEYQDSDPAQESLLLALAGDGRELIAVGDPDQSIYEFRGADVRALTEFPERFRAAAGQPAPVIALQTCRRSGPVLLAASRRVARRLPRGPIGHRDLITGNPAAGEVRILIADSSTQEAALVADTLRRAHLADGVPWSSMAVLVRSAARQVPLLRRALTVAGIPVTVAGDELPLADEPGTRPLLMLLRCALRPAMLDEQTAAELLCGPLGGTDALGLRRLRRSLGLLAEAAGDRGRGGGDLLAEALLSPRDLVALPDSVAGPARQVARLLAVAKTAIKAGGNAEDVLWAIWDASGLAPQWQQASAAGGAAGAAADRDLDAVLALFDKAAHFADTMPPGSPGLFADSLGGQEIVGDTLAERAVRDDCVRVLTAHRSKGLEWDVVVVAGVQEASWPDLRLRGSVLGAGELAEAARPGEAFDRGQGADVDAAMLAAKLLAEERRLFYVAVTRARRRLVVTAAGGEDTDLRPSRFLTELAGDDVPIERVGGGHGAHRWLSMPALVADLRRAAAETGRPLAVRQAAAAQLARLAAAGVRAAHPRDWYALTELSDARLDRGRRRDRPAVPVPGRVVHPVRAALAARGRGRRRTLGRPAPPGHGHSRRRRAGRLRGDRAAGGGADRRDLAPPGLRQRLVQRQAAVPGRAHGAQVPRLARGQPPRPGRGGGVPQGPDRPGGDHRPGRPAGVRRSGPCGGGRPEDRGQRAARGRAGPAPPARRVPAGRAARRVRAVRPVRAGRRGARPGRQGVRRDPAGQGAAAGRAGRRPGAGLGQGPGRDRRGRHGRPGLPGPGQPRLPHLPGRLLLPG